MKGYPGSPRGAEIRYHKFVVEPTGSFLSFCNDLTVGEQEQRKDTVRFALY